MIQPPRDIEPTIPVSREHSLHFLHIVVHNKTGILNRITSLMRRKRFNLHEVSVSADDNDLTHIVVAIDSAESDVSQAIAQLRKIHDVVSVNDATEKKESFFNVFYVCADDPAEYDAFPTKPVDYFKRNGRYVAMFRVPLDHTASFADFVRSNGYHFRRRIVTIL